SPPGAPPPGATPARLARPPVGPAGCRTERRRAVTSALAYRGDFVAERVPRGQARDPGVPRVAALRVAARRLERTGHHGAAAHGEHGPRSVDMVDLRSARLWHGRAVMRHNFVNDIGDYAKYALLRALCAYARDDARLGVLWYLTEHQETNGDGRRRPHLSGDGWDALDPELLRLMRGLETR